MAKRNEEHSTLDTLVIDYISDTTINNIFHNPVDLSNAFKVFAGLKGLLLSIKRQEDRLELFNRNLWFLIRKATQIESICLFGWNTKRDNNVRQLENEISMDYREWRTRSLPYPIEHAAKIKSIRFLELKRLDIFPLQLVALIKDCSLTLKELYLIEMYLKVNGVVEGESISMWVGYPDFPKPNSACWVAQSFREMEGLNLSTLRATGLGYDDFERNLEMLPPDYDICDYSFAKKSLDQRFVEAVMHPDIEAVMRPLVQDEVREASPGMTGMELDESETHLEANLPPMNNSTPLPSPPTPTPAGLAAIASSHSTSTTSITTPPSPDTSHLEPASSTLRLSKLQPIDYDAETFQKCHNTTSLHKNSIDGHFDDHREHAFRELQNMIDVADRGMDLINQEIRAYRHFDVDEPTGLLVPPSTAA